MNNPHDDLCEGALSALFSAEAAGIFPYLVPGLRLAEGQPEPKLDVEILYKMLVTDKQLHDQLGELELLLGNPEIARLLRRSFTEGKIEALSLQFVERHNKRARSIVSELEHEISDAAKQ